MDHSRKKGSGPRPETLTDAEATFGFVSGRINDREAGVTDLLAAGTDLGGVTILHLLASGGMGQVYVAEQHAPPRRVAVKVVSTEVAERVGRLLDDEATLLGQLEHPHIARVHTVGWWTVAGSRLPWIMMELVRDGRAITAWAKDADLSVDRRVALVGAAAAAVAAAHAKGVLHLDLKPANILVDRDGVVKLIDFGIGRRVGGGDMGDRRPAAVVGTPASMSPEQFTGRADLIDARSDIYGLGRVLYELVAGHPPADRPAGTGRGRLLAVAHGSANPPATDAAPGHPAVAEGLRRQVAQAARQSGCGRFAAADLAAIVSRCLAVQPADRFATAWELTEELACWQSGRPLRCRPPGPLERAARRVVRHPVEAGLVGLVLVIALAAAVAIVRFSLASDRERRRAEQAADAARVSLAAALLRQAVAAGNQHEAETAGQLLADRQATLATLTTPPAAGLLPRSDGLAVRCLRAGLDEAAASWANPQGAVTAVAAAAEGGRVVVGDASGRATVLSLPAFGFEETAAFDTGVGRVWAVAVSRAGDRAAVAGDSGEIQLLRIDEPSSGKRLRRAGGRIYAVAFSPDGSRLVSGGRDGRVRLWNLERGEVERAFGPVSCSIYGIAVSPDGATLAAALRDGTVQLWNLPTGEPAGRLQGHQGRVFSVAFSPDGLLLASASEDQTVRLWDCTSLREQRRFDHPVRVNAVQFCGRDRLVTAAGDRLLRCWQVAGQRPPRELAGHGGSLWAVATVDGTVLTASADGSVRRWNGGGDPQPRLAVPAAVKCLALTEDGRQLAIGTVAGGVRICNAVSGRPLAEVDLAAGPVNGLCWLPGSRAVLVAAGDGTVSRYRLTGAAKPPADADLELILDRQFRGHRRRVFAVTATADGGTIATAGEDKTVRIWTAAAATEIAELAHAGRVFTVAYSVSGRLASGCEDGVVRVFSPAGRLLYRAGGHKGQVNSVGWNPRPQRDWDLASAGADGFIRLWRLPQISRDASKPVDAVLVRTLAGANGKIWQLTPCRREPLLVAATDTGSVILWNTDEPSPLEVLTGHGDAAWAVALGPGEQWLASGGWDRAVRFWGIPARSWTGWNREKPVRGSQRQSTRKTAKPSSAGS